MDTIGRGLSLSDRAIVFAIVSRWDWRPSERQGRAAVPREAIAEGSCCASLDEWELGRTTWLGPTSEPAPCCRRHRGRDRFAQARSSGSGGCVVPA